MIGAIHDKLIRRRRVQSLAVAIAEMLPKNVTILDVGCGDGELDQRLAALRDDVQIQGIDVLVREEVQNVVSLFDGERIPSDDNSVDVVLLIDVLHHTEDPIVLLKEAKRVARRAVIIKDHCRNGILAGPTLRLMDWVGDARHGVSLPYNYWRRERWLTTFEQLHLNVEQWRSKLGLYSAPLGWFFERSLHFLARLSATSAELSELEVATNE